MTGIEVKAFAAFVLLALGITAPLPDVVGGMMIALGACYAVMIVTPPENRMTLWGTLVSGFIFSIIAAIAHPHIFFVHSLPLQLVMAAAGALSRWFGGWINEFGKGGMERARAMPGKLRLPWEREP